MRLLMYGNYGCDTEYRVWHDVDNVYCHRHYRDAQQFCVTSARIGKPCSIMLPWVYLWFSLIFLSVDLLFKLQFVFCFDTFQ